MENNPIAQWVVIIIGSAVMLLVLWDLYFNEHDPDDYDLP
jgi:hypothetical protein